MGLQYRLLVVAALAVAAHGCGRIAIDPVSGDAGATSGSGEPMTDAAIGAAQCTPACGTGMFCEAQGGQCGGTGTCVEVPKSSECFGIAYECGCDGVTYQNGCIRQTFKVSMDHVGTCAGGGS